MMTTTPQSAGKPVQSACPLYPRKRTLRCIGRDVRFVPIADITFTQKWKDRLAAASPKFDQVF